MLVCFLVAYSDVQAQFSCRFSSSTATTPYSTIIGLAGNGSYANAPAGQWNNAIGSIFLLTPFSFNGTAVTTCTFSANGYIWFGSGPNPATNATAGDVLSLPSLGIGNIGVIAAFARDLGEHPSISSAPVPANGGFGRRLVQYRAGGTIPNRYTIIEFAGFYPQVVGSGCTGVNLPDNHRIDFQIKLYESNATGINPNRIEILYRDQTPFCNDSPYSFQVGVRGVAPTEFICRTQNGGNLTATSTAPGTSNTDKIVFNGGDHVEGSSTALIFDQTDFAVSVNPSSASICSGESVELIASGGSNYTWSPASGLNTTTGSTVIATPSLTTVYKVTATFETCSASDSATVTIVNSVPASISGDLSFCAGGSTTLTANDGSSYLWSNGATTQSITVNTSGSYTVTVTPGGSCPPSSTTVIVDASNVSPTSSPIYHD